MNQRLFNYTTISCVMILIALVTADIYVTTTKANASATRGFSIIESITLQNLQMDRLEQSLNRIERNQSDFAARAFSASRAPDSK